MAQPRLARPVFSSEDFGLLRHAIAQAIKNEDDGAMSRKLVNLHHRLGRIRR